MGDGKDNPITKYVAGQYASYYSYWLNYSDLNKFYAVFQKWDPTLRYNIWKSNLHNLIPINEAEYNYKINVENRNELVKMKAKDQTTTALKIQAKQALQQLRQKVNTASASAKGKEKESS